MARARRRLPRATRLNSTVTSTPSGRSSKSMSKVESIATASPQYRAWLQRERRGHLVVRLTQLAILVVFLVLWEVLPKAHIINPVLTSYPSALWPTFLELLKTTPQQASILAHTCSTVLVPLPVPLCRILRRDGARHRDRRGAVVVAPALPGARSVSGGGERHAEDRLR